MAACPVKFYINTHKASTVVALLAMILIFRQWANFTAWVYLLIHSSYGALWVVKSRFFPDKRFLNFYL